MKKLFLLGIIIPFLNTSCCSIFTSARQTVTFVGKEGTRIYDNGMKIATIGDSGEVYAFVKKYHQKNLLLKKKDIDQHH